MKVYELLHTYYIYENTPCYSCKRLGYYSDLKKIEDAISFSSKLPGFCDAPNGFIVKQKEVSGAASAECFYEALIFAHTEDYNDYEVYVELGLYFDKTDAQAAVDAFCEMNPAFMNDPLLEIERLIEKYTIDKCCGWEEGFTVEPF